jgi:hypothetical protein
MLLSILSAADQHIPFIKTNSKSNQHTFPLSPANHQPISLTTNSQTKETIRQSKK